MAKNDRNTNNPREDAVASIIQIKKIILKNQLKSKNYKRRKEILRKVLEIQ